eukprot:COSAG05_NODE_8278_length_719_cov_0.908065_1_plen_108_part_10
MSRTTHHACGHRRIQRRGKSLHVLCAIVDSHPLCRPPVPVDQPSPGASSSPISDCRAPLRRMGRQLALWPLPLLAATVAAAGTGLHDGDFEAKWVFREMAAMPDGYPR